MGDDCIPEDVAGMTGSFVLCLDGLAGSGDFVWSKWLLKAVKSGRSVVLVSMRHSPEHYEALFKKSMLDLRLGYVRGHVKIMYMVPGSLDDNLIVGEEEVTRVSAANDFYPCAHYDWERFETWVSTILQHHQDDTKREALFIDDLDMFEAVAPSQAAARRMLCKLLSCIHGSNLGAIDLLAAKGSLGWADLEGHDHDVPEASEPSLTEVCKYRANCTVQVVPLSTGFSNDVHGVIKATSLRGGLMKREEYTFKNVNVSSVYCTKLTK